MNRWLSKFLFMTLLLWCSMDLLAYETANSLLTTCPTEPEIASVHKDFNIFFKNLDPDYRCTPTDESNRQLAAYNILRLLKDIKFTQPLPWVAYTSSYEWLKSLKLRKIVFSDSGP